MSILLVTFDVEEILQDTLVKTIRNLGSWARINANTYCIMSYDKNEKTIREILTDDIGEEGKTFHN